jgi:hypothetical protein
LAYKKIDDLHTSVFITGPENVYLGLEFSKELVPSPRVEDRCESTPKPGSDERGRQVAEWVMEMLSEMRDATGQEIYVSRIVFVSDSSDSRDMYRRAANEIVRQAFDIKR